MSTDDNAMSRTEIEQTLRRFWDAWRARDVDALMEFMGGPECVYDASVGPGPGSRFVGRDAVRAGFASMLAYDDALRLDDREIYIDVDGNRAIAEWAELGEDGDGAQIEIRGIDIFEFVDGKIERKDAFRKMSDGD